MSNFELRIEQLENRSIQIVPNKNVAATLRSIAEGVGFKLEEKWDSFQIGAKLIDFINENSDENAKLKDAVKKAAVVNVSLAGAEGNAAKPAKQATGSNIIDLNNDPDVQAYLNARPEVKYIILKELISWEDFVEYDPKEGVSANFNVNDVTDRYFKLFRLLKEGVASKEERGVNLYKYSKHSEKDVSFHLEDLNSDDLLVLNHFFDVRCKLDTDDIPKKQFDNRIKELLSLDALKMVQTFEISSEDYSFSLPDDLTGLDNVKYVFLEGVSELPMGLSKLKNLKSLTIKKSDLPFKVNGDVSGFENLTYLSIKAADLSFDDAVKFAKLPELSDIYFSDEAFPDEDIQEKIKDEFEDRYVDFYY